MGKVIIGVIVLAVVVGGVLFMQGSRDSGSGDGAKAPGTPKDAAMPVSPATKKDAMAPASGSIKEFTTTAYYDDKGVWYSLKEMRVKQGERVRVKATNTKGMHDFVIDELGVKQELPLNQEVVVEFTADKKGTFVYYCSKPGHRAKGQWGNLIVE